MTSAMEDDKRRSPFTTVADGLLPFGFTVLAGFWTGDTAKGSAALASNAISSDDMLFNRLGSYTYIGVGCAWNLIGTTFIFQGHRGKQGNGAKGTIWT